MTAASLPAAIRRAFTQPGRPAPAAAYVVQARRDGAWTHIDAPGHPRTLTALSLRLLEAVGADAVTLRVIGADGAVLDYAADFRLADLTAAEAVAELPAAA